MIIKFYSRGRKNLTLFFKVNQGKPKNINKKVRFISWVRQISDLNQSLDYFNDNDLIYTLKKTNNNFKLKINQLLIT